MRLLDLLELYDSNLYVQVKLLKTPYITIFDGMVKHIFETDNEIYNDKRVSSIMIECGKTTFYVY